MFPNILQSTHKMQRVKVRKQLEVKVSMKRLFVTQILQLSPVHHNQIEKHHIFVLHRDGVHHHWGGISGKQNEIELCHLGSTAY